MKSTKVIAAALAALFLGLILSGHTARAGANSAKITYLAGKAFKSKKKEGPWDRLYKNRRLEAGYYVKTGPGSRIEITMPDGSKIRLASDSILYLSEARFEKETRDYRAHLMAGKVYTRARPARSLNEKFIIRTSGAVAGIRGTSFDTILMPDGATRVKCFEGKVWVATWADYARRYLNEEKEDEKSILEQWGKAKEVPGPEEVTEEEWMKIAAAMMSVTVTADGKIQEPEKFSEEETDDWEDWNRERDKME